MEIRDLQKHTSCYCYDRKEQPQVEVVHIEGMQTEERTFVCNEFFFVLEGSISVTLRDNPSGDIHEGEFAFMPTGDYVQYTTLSQTTTILILRLHDGIHLCCGMSIEQLFYKMSEMEKPQKLVALQANDRLQHFTKGLVDTWKDGLKCGLYLRAEVSRLLTMLSAYYSREELCLFFYPILSPDTAFSEFVRRDWLKYHTVNELSRAMNLTTQQFARRFNAVFKQNPREWMQKEKARLIYEDICMNIMPLKEVSDKYGFTDQANFNRFCKKFFETTPGEIRRNRL